MTTKGLSPSMQEAVVKRVEEIGSEVIPFLQELVRIPAVNPPGEHYVESAQLLGGKAKALGYETHYIAAEGCREHTEEYPRLNVLGRMEGSLKRPCLHFNGHFDVVPVGEGWTVDPF